MQSMSRKHSSIGMRLVNAYSQHDAQQNVSASARLRLRISLSVCGFWGGEGVRACARTLNLDVGRQC
jgi:hypothetical protein